MDALTSGVIGVDIVDICEFERTESPESLFALLAPRTLIFVFSISTNCIYLIIKIVECWRPKISDLLKREVQAI